MNEAEVLAAIFEEKEWRLKVTATCRVRYFADGAVIGSKGFVNDVFEGARERFNFLVRPSPLRFDCG